MDGNLLISGIPHWKHQAVIGRACLLLDRWSSSASLGEVIPMPGIVFDPENDVIPDVIWISQSRLLIGVDEEGHFTIAPELMIEVLSRYTE